LGVWIVLLHWRADSGPASFAVLAKPLPTVMGSSRTGN
jgi:hypothetical protein